jgi:cycloeucalenol cycloisomerase
MESTAWFSKDEDKAWAEKFFLLYSPVWMAFMGMMMLTGWVNSFSNLALVLHSCLVALPLVVVPFLFRRKTDIPWYASYWFKANLYIFVFSFFGNYFGSEYFFDVLGMVYNFPNATTTFDSATLGDGTQTVPLIMYLYTQAYFITYHTSAVVVLRRLMNSSFPAKTIMFLPLVFMVGYVWAWLETKAMANPLMASSFYYEKMDLMLAYGSIIYATYFIASFPIFYFINEKVKWDNLKVIAAAMSASMITFYLLDFSAHIIGSL